MASLDRFLSLLVLVFGLTDAVVAGLVQRSTTFSATWVSTDIFNGELVESVTVYAHTLDVNKTAPAGYTLTQFNINNNGVLTASDGTQLCFLDTGDGYSLLGDPRGFTPPSNCPDSQNDNFGLFRGAYLTWGGSFDTWCILSGDTNAQAGFGGVIWVPGLSAYEVHPDGCQYRGRILLNGLQPNPTPTVQGLRAAASAVSASASAYATAINAYISSNGSGNTAATAAAAWTALQGASASAAEDAGLLYGLGQITLSTLNAAYPPSTVAASISAFEAVKYFFLSLAKSKTIQGLAAVLIAAALADQPTNGTPQPEAVTSTSSCPLCDCAVNTAGYTDIDDQYTNTDSLALYTTYSPTPSPTPTYPLPVMNYALSYTTTTRPAASAGVAKAAARLHPTSTASSDNPGRSGTGSPRRWERLVAEQPRTEPMADGVDYHPPSEDYTVCSVTYDNPNFPSSGQARAVGAIRKWYDWVIYNGPAPVCPWQLQLGGPLAGSRYATEHIYEKHFIATYLRWLSGQHNTPCSVINMLGSRSTTSGSSFTSTAPLAQLALALSDNTRPSELAILRSDVNTRKYQILSTYPQLAGGPTIQASSPWDWQLNKLRHVTMAFAYLNEDYTLQVFQNVSRRMKVIYSAIDQDSFYAKPSGAAGCTGWLQCYQTWLDHFFAYRQYTMWTYIEEAVDAMQIAVYNSNLDQDDMGYVLQFIQTQSNPSSGGLLSPAAVSFRPEYLDLAND